MGSEEGAQAPAGWYDDPERDGRQRYWDGVKWTTRRRRTLADDDDRFRTLRLMASLWTGLGWIVVILGTIAVLAIASAEESQTALRGGDTISVSGDRGAVAITVGVWVAILALGLFTLGAYLRLSISNESNTKRMADLLAERPEP